MIVRKENGRWQSCAMQQSSATVRARLIPLTLASPSFAQFVIRETKEIREKKKIAGAAVSFLFQAEIEQAREGARLGRDKN